MKAIFYLLDGDTNASSRQRVLQFFPALRKAGIEPAASRPAPAAVYERLIEQGSGRMSQKLAFYAVFLASRLMDVLRAGSYDVAVVQRDLFPFGPPILERLLARQANRLAYDTDDATYLRPAFTPKTPTQHLRRFDKVAEVVRRARWVSVATEPIAAWARQYNPRVDVVPMCVDLPSYDRVPRRPKTGPLVLGWAGTAGGLAYLEKLGPVLRELGRDHEFVLRVVSGGYARLKLPGVPLDARPWREHTALPDMAGFDAGLVPLDGTPFEQAKFPFKLLQYFALGVPAIAARVGVAVDVVSPGENGLLAGSADEWRDQLRRVITDADLRRRLAAGGRQTVQDRYTLERVTPLLVRGLYQASGHQASGRSAGL